MPLVGYTPVGGQATYDPDTNTISVAGYGDIPENLGVKTILEELQSADGDILASNRHNCYPRGIRRQRSGAAKLLGPGVPDPAGSADHPGQQLCADDRQSDDRHAPPGVAADSGVRYPRCHAAARRSPRYRSTTNRTEGTLHSFNVAYQRILARRIHSGNCVCRQSRPRHPRGLQHERGSRRLAPTTPAVRFSESTEEPPTRRTRSRSDPSTTRCR